MQWQNCNCYQEQKYLFVRVQINACLIYGSPYTMINILRSVHTMTHVISFKASTTNLLVKLTVLIVL
jgi:hypothetical protein